MVKDTKKVQYVVYKFPSKIDKKCGYFSIYDVFSEQKYFWRVPIEKIGDAREEKQKIISYSKINKLYLGFNIIGGVPDCVACVIPDKFKIRDEEKELIESYSLRS